MLNGHGDDIYSYDTTIVSNFSSNVFNNLDLSGLQKHLCEKISSIHSYPEPDGYSLVQQLAQYHGITGDNICLTNGATEAIYLIAQAFRGRKASIVIPTFSEYEDACRINDINIQFVSSLEDISRDSDLVWICNPNNPTGKVWAKQDLLDVIKQRGNTVFVIDQSYSFFTTKSTFDADEIIRMDNVILLHSMTKCYAIPGLRLGYFIASEGLATRIKYYTMPWSVNQLALEAGKYLLNSNFISSFDINLYLEEVRRFRKKMEAIDKLHVYPSDTHFFLCEMKQKKASDLKSYLIEQYGILIRDASNFRGLNEYCFRVATQSREENDQLVKAIKEWI